MAGRLKQETNGETFYWAVWQSLREIVKRAESFKAGFVVVSSRWLPPTTRLLMGNVLDGVSSMLPVPS